MGSIVRLEFKRWQSMLRDFFVQNRPPFQTPLGRLNPQRVSGRFGTQAQMDIMSSRQYILIAKPAMRPKYLERFWNRLRRLPIEN